MLEGTQDVRPFPLAVHSRPAAVAKTRPANKVLGHRAVPSLVIPGAHLDEGESDGFQWPRNKLVLQWVVCDPEPNWSIFCDAQALGIYL